MTLSGLVFGYHTFPAQLPDMIKACPKSSWFQTLLPLTYPMCVCVCVCVCVHVWRSETEGSRFLYWGMPLPKRNSTQLTVLADGAAITIRQTWLSGSASVLDVLSHRLDSFCSPVKTAVAALKCCWPVWWNSEKALARPSSIPANCNRNTQNTLPLLYMRTTYTIGIICKMHTLDLYKHETSCIH